MRHLGRRGGRARPLALERIKARQERRAARQRQAARAPRHAHTEPRSTLTLNGPRFNLVWMQRDSSPLPGIPVQLGHVRPSTEEMRRLDCESAAEWERLVSRETGANWAGTTSIAQEGSIA